MNPPPGGFVDLHSHLIPGVDDGSRTVAEAVDGITRLWNAGVRRVATTPHLRGSLTQDRADLAARLRELDEGWEQLRVAVAEAFPDLVLQRGAEVMLDVPDPDLSHPSLHLGDTSYVLVEWPHLTVPPGTLRVLERIRKDGVKPVIAHPERYSGFDRGLGVAGEWREAGAFLQMNYGSLLGRYGEEVRGRAFSILERGWVDLLSTDFHGRPNLPLSLLEVRGLFAGMRALELFNVLARENPNRILSGSQPLPLPPLPRRRGWRDRLKDLLRGTAVG